MSIKIQLCNIIIDIKDTDKLTYDKLHEITDTHRSQLVSIIKHQGKDVSVEVIEYVIKCLGGEVELHLRNI